MARILIADDALPIRRLLARQLQAAGHVVVEASDGISTYEVGAAGGVDLAILDCIMPGLMGVEVLTRWRSLPTNFPVIFLSAVDDDAMIVRTLALGADDYIRKPFRLPELMARVSRRLEPAGD